MPGEVQGAPVLFGTVEQHVPECGAGLALPIITNPATAAPEAQIMIAPVVVSSAFLFNGLMLSFSGMATRPLL
jgi:hypothetical protein